MSRQLVYDLPTRLFHWLFAGLFLTAFIIANTLDDDSSWFNYHSLAGLTLGFLVLLRIVWGVFGTQHARFSDFSLNPLALVGYFKGVLSGDKKRWAGHNPASSWAGIIMMFLALGLATTGYLMASGNEDAFEDIHELFADAFIVVVVLHVAGVVFHSIRHKEMIGLSMVDGKKTDVPVKETISSSRSAFGVLLIALVVAFGLNLYKNYDVQSRSLQLFGTTLQLGEDEGHEYGGHGSGRESDHDDDDDD
jgi:cytochrome b